MINFMLLVSRQGKTRLTKWYESYGTKEKARIVREVTARSPASVDLWLPDPRGSLLAVERRVGVRVARAPPRERETERRAKEDVLGRRRETHACVWGRVESGRATRARARFFLSFWATFERACRPLTA